MKLYENAIAPNCRRVRVFLAEKGIDVPGVEIDIIGGQNISGDYLEVNPNGQLPGLELDDGRHLSESAAICRYFEELHPQPPLLGTTPFEKAAVQMWERRADFEGMLGVADNFRNRFPPFENRGIAGTSNVPQIPELVERGRQSVQRFYGHLDKRLGESPYLVGDSLTLADIDAMCVVDFALFSELEIPQSHSKLRAWYDGMESRESARSNPGLTAALGSISKVLGG
jgi:glutathione S-transferase